MGPARVAFLIFFLFFGECVRIVCVCVWEGVWEGEWLTDCATTTTTGAAQSTKKQRSEGDKEQLELHLGWGCQLAAWHLGGSGCGGVGELFRVSRAWK